MAEPSTEQKKEWGWLDPGPTTDRNAEIKAQLDRMWGHLGTESTYGWLTCQFVREGRVLLTQGEWESACKNRAVIGEKYCADHMPHTPNRLVWFLIGAAAMWGVVHLHLL